jgi:hypothetical protein
MRVIATTRAVKGRMKSKDIKLTFDDNVSRSIFGCQAVGKPCFHRTDGSREVESNLETARALYASFQRIASSNSSQAVEARDDYRNALALLQADVKDLEESVRVVEQMGPRWGIDGQEIQRRRAFVQRVRVQVKVG